MRIHFIILVLFLAAFGTAAGAYVYAAPAKELDSLPESVAAAEEAIALDGIVGLMHVNVKGALELEGKFPDEASWGAFMAPLDHIGLLSELLNQEGLDFRASLDQLLAALVLSREGVVGVGIGLGHFEVDRVIERLHRQYQTEAAELSGESVLLLVKEDPMTCKLSPPMALHLTPERLIAGAPDQVAAVLDRLETGASAAMNLKKWRAYRDGKLLSLALFEPPLDVAAQMRGPMTLMTASIFKKALAKLEEVYASLSFQDLPPRLIVESRFTSGDSDWVKGTVASYAAWSAEVAASGDQDIPALRGLADVLSLRAEGPLLIAAAALGEDFFSHAGQLPGELVRLRFAKWGIAPNPRKKKNTDPSGLPRDWLIPPEELVHYQEQTSHQELPSFDPQLDTSFGAATRNGPFAIRVESFRLSKSEEGLVEVKIEAMSGEMPNMAMDPSHTWDHQRRGRFFITDVLDAEGASLRREVRCGPKRSSLPVQMRPKARGLTANDVSRRIQYLKGSTSFHLVPGAGVNDIGAIRGYFELRLPTRTLTSRVAAPFDAQVVESSGLRIDLKSNEPDEIVFDVSGEKDRLLATHGLTAAGQRLHPKGYRAAHGLSSRGRIVRKHFYGVPAIAEFVIAVEEITEIYPFEITPVTPPFDRWESPGDHEVVTATAEGFRQDVDDLDLGIACVDRPADNQPLPFQMCPQSSNSPWLKVRYGALWGDLEVLAPILPSLKGNLSGLEIQVDSVRVGEDTIAETILVPIDYQEYPRLRGVNDEGHLEYWSRIRGKVPKTLEKRSIASLQGRLVVRLPVKLSSFILDVRDLGARASHPVGIEAHLVGFFDGRLVLELTAPRDRIVQFIARDGKGVVLATDKASVAEAKEPGLLRALLAVSGRPESLEIVFAEDQKLIEYPFDLANGTP